MRSASNRPLIPGSADTHEAILLVVLVILGVLSLPRWLIRKLNAKLVG